MRRRILSDPVIVALLLAFASGEVRAQGSLASPGAGTWWLARNAPSLWTGPSPSLARAIQWVRLPNGVDHAELDITVNGGPLRVHVILARFEPSAFHAKLVTAVDESRLRGTWTIDSADASAIVAVNAGQFAETGPWGWIIDHGRELAPPGAGPLAAAVAFDSTGLVHWLNARAIADARSRGVRFTAAFQSYPVLIASGAVPAMVRSGRGMDSGHRDARLAIGQSRDGRVILALTRFGVRESTVSRLPIGLTVRETAALMGALGCRDAIMLDGGLSAQMMIRQPNGEPLMWRGVRRVPVGLVFSGR